MCAGMRLALRCRCRSMRTPRKGCMCTSVIRRCRNPPRIWQTPGRGPVFLVWPNAYSRLAEHANTVLTNITSSTLMYDYHGLGEHRTQP